MKRIKKYVLLTAVLLSSCLAFAQNSDQQKKQTEKKQDNLNKRDYRNQKQGMWFIEQEALRGEPAYMTFGSYKDNKKDGTWYKLDKEGELISIESFFNGNLNGTAKYFERGRLVITGNYRGLNQEKSVDSIWVTDPQTLYEVLVGVPTEQGSVKHGVWRYYDVQTGQLISEETYQVNNLIDKKDFNHAPIVDSAKLQKRYESFPHNKYPNKGMETKSNEKYLLPTNRR